MADKTNEKELNLEEQEVKETKKEKKFKKNDCQQQLGETVEKYQRLLADMENLRKRTEEEKADNYKYRASGFIIEILPTIDMFEQALSAKNVSDEVKNWLIGFEMVLNNFKNTLANEGVEKIKAEVGGEFDHNLHHAIEEKETDEVEPGKILEVKLDGYTLKGRLLRPASVVIAKDKNAEEKKAN